jgi:hypothetical protein
VARERGPVPLLDGLTVPATLILGGHDLVTGPAQVTAFERFAPHGSGRRSRRAARGGPFLRRGDHGGGRVGGTMTRSASAIDQFVLAGNNRPASVRGAV